MERRWQEAGARDERAGAKTEVNKWAEQRTTAIRERLQRCDSPPGRLGGPSIHGCTILLTGDVYATTSSRMDASSRSLGRRLPEITDEPNG